MNHLKSEQNLHVASFRMHYHRNVRILLFMIVAAIAKAEDIRIGMIGLDTIHAVEFTRILNDPASKDHVKGARVVGAFKASSPDIRSSWSLVDGYVERLQKQFEVKIYESIDDLAKQVDGILVVSVDGRPHLEQARAVILAGKPLFIDKPLAASLRESLEIFDLAALYKVPVFSASSLRFAEGTKAVRNGSIGKVIKAEARSPAHLEPHHIDLFWYGIHGVESLFTVLGPGIQSVSRKNSALGSIEVVGQWDGDRMGVFREIKGFGGQAFGERGEAEIGKFDGYAPLVAEIVKFFQTGISPVPTRETIEIIAFMEADALSKARNGETVRIAEVFERIGRKKPTESAR